MQTHQFLSGPNTATVQIPERGHLTVRALPGNTDTVYIGHNSDVSALTGFPLVNTSQPVEIWCRNPYIFCATNNMGVAVISQDA